MEENPIILWRDPKDNRLKLLAGHHRYDLFKRKGEGTIPSIEFQGTEEEAIERAHTENAEGKAESAVDRAGYYRNQRTVEGGSQADMMRRARTLEGRNATGIIRLSYLNPTGKAIGAIKSLGTETGASARDAVTMAEWVGRARMDYPQLSNSHENELFDFLKENYKTQGKGFRSSEQFMDFVAKVVERNTTEGVFNQSEPLNVKNLRAESKAGQEVRQRFREAEQLVRDAQKALEVERARRIAAGIQGEDLDRVLKSFNDAVSVAQRDLQGLGNMEDKLGEVQQQEIGLFGEIDKIKEDLRNAGASEQEIESAERDASRDDELAGVEEEEIAPAEVQKEIEEPKPERTVVGNAKLGERFAKMADTLDDVITDKRREMTQNPTPKRMREYRSRLVEADDLERVQKAMRVLSGLHSKGRVPELLANVKTKEEIYRLVYKGTEGGGGYYDVIVSYEYKNKTPEGRLLQSLIEGEKSAEQIERERRREVEELEAKVQFTPIAGFFPTPQAVVAEMVDKAGIESGMDVLEPSAGKGDIAEMIVEPDVKLTMVEVNPTLRDILIAKQKAGILEDAKVSETRDFLETTPESIGRFDRILMNPPFERGQDIDHVRHAYDLLKPGGRVVAIMSEGSFSRNDRKATEFRDWMESVGGESERLEEGAFKKGFTPTAVSSRIVTIDKEGVREKPSEAPEKLNREKLPVKLTKEDFQSEVRKTFTNASEEQIQKFFLILDAEINYRAKDLNRPQEELYAEMFAGLRGSQDIPDNALFQYIGQNANLAEDIRSNLHYARYLESEGKDAGPGSKVQLATGWFRNPYDNMWRYEIQSDKLTRKITQKELAPSAIYARSYKLSEVIGYEELFAAYPQTRDIKVVVSPFMAGNTQGAFNAADATITLNSDWLRTRASTEDFKKTLLHEIQHAIQYAEGFASGGNLSKYLPEGYNDLAIEAKRLLIQIGSLQNQLEMQTDVDRAAEQEKKLMRLQVEHNEAVKKLLKFQNEAVNKYLRVAGEIEARDVEARMNLNRHERLLTKPLSSENISPDQAIVLFGEAFEEELSISSGFVNDLSESEKQAFIRKYEHPDREGLIEEILSNGHKINIDGTIDLYHGTTKEAAKKIVSESVLRIPKDAPDTYGVHFSTSSEIDENYGDGTVIRIRVKVRDLNLEDVFPNGRMDFMAVTKAKQYRPVEIAISKEVQHSISDVRQRMERANREREKLEAELKPLVERRAQLKREIAFSKEKNIPISRADAYNELAATDKRIGEIRETLSKPLFETDQNTLFQDEQKILRYGLTIEKKPNEYSYTDATKQSIVSAYRSGVSTPELSDASGIGETSILRWLQNEGIVRTTAETKGITDDVRKQIVELYESGMSGPQVAKTLGIGSSTVHRELMKQGKSRGLEEVRNIDPEIKAKAIELYQVEQLNTYEVAKALGVGQTSVARWIRQANVSRGYSAAQALRVSLGRIKGRGISSNVTLPSGKIIHTDSTYELARVVQLSKMSDVVSVERATHQISYREGAARYNPDLLVKTKDGRTIIEEIKPAGLITAQVLEKAQAAKEFYAEKGIEYRLISEIDIGYEGFSNDILDATDLSGEDKQRAEQSFATARWYVNNFNTLRQSKKGAVQFLQDGRAIIHAFESADISTLVHETQHIFLAHRIQDASHGSTQAKADIRAIEEWAGIGEGEAAKLHDAWVKGTATKEQAELYRRMQEKFARGFERYLAEGKAPTERLKAVFEKFEQWLMDIYEGITGSDIDVQLSPAIKDLFGRMLGKQNNEEALSVLYQEDTKEPIAPTKAQNDLYVHNLIEELQKQRKTRKIGQRRPPVVALMKDALGVYVLEGAGKGLRGARLIEYVRGGLVKTLRDSEEYKTYSASGRLQAAKRLETENVERWIRFYIKQQRKQEAQKEIDARNERIATEAARRLVSEKLPQEMTEKLLRLSQKYRTNRDTQGKFFSRFWSRLKVMAESYGAAGGELANRMYDGDIERGALMEAGNRYLDKIKEVYDKIENPFRRDEISDEVVRALEDRANAQKYLKSEESKAVYKDAKAMLDYFKTLLDQKGYLTTDDYFTHILDVDIIDQVLRDIEDPSTAKGKPLNDFITATSAFLKPRTGADIRIRKDVPYVLSSYLRSVTRELAYREGVQYYYERFQKDIPVALQRNSMERAKVFMKNVLEPERGKGKFFRAINFIRNQQYRNFLGMNLKASAQNMTQSEFARFRWLPEADKLRKKIYRQRDMLTGALADAVDVASQETPRYLELIREEESIGASQLSELFNRIDTFQKSEGRNWGIVELGSILNSAMKDPRYQALKKEKGQMAAIQEVLSNKEAFDKAVREAASTAAETQVASAPSMRGEFYDKPLSRVIGMFTAFKFRQLQVLGEALKDQKGIRGTRAQLILRKGLADEIEPVEVLREVEGNRTAMEKMLADAKKFKQNLGVSYDGVQQVIDHLKTQEGELNEIIGKLEPTKGKARAIGQLARYYAKITAISMFFSILWDLVDAGGGGDEDEEELLAQALKRAFFDILPTPFYGTNPARFLVSPVAPSLEDAFPYGQFSRRGLTRNVISYGFNVVPFGGIIDRATNRRLSRFLIDTISPKKNQPNRPLGGEAQKRRSLLGPSNKGSRQSLLK